MTFLNPLVLIGLAAASIPLILHLLNLRKPRTIEFSTLAFLKELQRTSIRRLRLRQIILLVLRTALVVFIVLTFARPVLRGSILGTVGTHAHTSVVLLLDDTFSMTASDEQGGLFKQAQARTRDIVDMLNEGDEACLLRLSDLPHATMESMSHDFSQLRAAVDETRVSFASATFGEALRLSAKILAGSHNVNKEIYVLSDMQRSLAKQPLTQDPVEDLFPQETRFFLAPFGSGVIGNTAIDSLWASSQILERNRPVRLMVRVQNYGKIPLRNHVVSLYLDKSRVAQRNVDLQPWSSLSTEFTILPKRSGLLSGYASIEQDAIEGDNNRFFTLSIPERIKIVCLSPSQEDVRYVILAFAATSEEKSNLFNVQHVTPQQLPLVDLGKVDVVILSNVPTFSGGDAHRLRAFVEQGGGLLIFPGSDLDANNYNTVLLPVLTIPPIEGRIGMPNEDSGAFSTAFQHIDTDHPIFSDVFEATEKQRPVIESPQVYVALKRQTGKHGRTIISLSDQIPFLSEYRLGEGAVLLFSSAPTISWTDFPLKGLFAPVMHRSALYAAAQAQKPFQYVVGEEPTVTLMPPAKGGVRLAQQLVLVSPDGTHEVIKQHTRSTPIGSVTTVPLKTLTQPGIYEIRAGQSILVQFSVNISKKESDLRKLTEDELEHVLGGVGVSTDQITHVQPNETLELTILQSRYGFELWKFFLIAAIVTAVAEMAVARDSSKQVAREHV